MKKLAVLALLALAAAPPASNSQRTEPAARRDGEEEVVRISTTLVAIPVSVFDRGGRFVPDLRREDFRVFEDGVEQEVAHFETADAPFAVALLLDTSGSVHFKLDEIKAAALAFVEQLRPEDSVLLVSFDSGVRVEAGPTGDRGALREAISRVSTGGGTALYDAVALTFGERLSHVRGRKAVVLFTDGVDNSSRRATYAGTLAQAEEAGALIYPVQYDTYTELVNKNLGPSFMGVLTTGGSSPVTGERESIRQSYERATRYLRLLASESGGEFFYADKVGRLSRTFARIAQHLRQQYSIGYYPRRPARGAEKRTLRVRVNVPNLAVRARQTYATK